MDRAAFRKLLSRRTLRLDGGLSTRLNSGLGDGLPAEARNLLDPVRVRDLHRSYLRAGCQILRTNTFGAHRETLAGAGMDGRVGEVIREGVGIARAAAAGRALVAGVLGAQPPPRTGSAAEGIERYGEPFLALIDSGPDLIVLETFTDAAEAAGLVAHVRPRTALPVVVFLSGPGDPAAGSLDGLPAAFAGLEAAGADAVGFNCSSGPSAAVRVLRAAAARWRGPLAAAPSAGLPARTPEGDRVWPGSPEEWAAECLPLPWDRIRLWGGCCGTGPDHLRALRAALRPRRAGGMPDAGRGRRSPRGAGNEAPGSASPGRR